MMHADVRYQQTVFWSPSCTVSWSGRVWYLVLPSSHIIPSHRLHCYSLLIMRSTLSLAQRSVDLSLHTLSVGTPPTEYARQNTCMSVISSRRAQWTSTILEILGKTPYWHYVSSQVNKCFFHWASLGDNIPLPMCLCPPMEVWPSKVVGTDLERGTDLELFSLWLPVDEEEEGHKCKCGCVVMTMLPSNWPRLPNDAPLLCLLPKFHRIFCLQFGCSLSKSFLLQCASCCCDTDMKMYACHLLESVSQTGAEMRSHGLACLCAVGVFSSSLTVCVQYYIVLQHIVLYGL